MIEDREPDEPASQFRFLARLDRPDRTPQRLTALVGVLIVVAIVKPWAIGADPAAPPEAVERGTQASAPAPPTLDPALDHPTVAPNPAVAAVSTVCLGPASWRMASIETWDGQRVRVWRALDPGPASGPSDPDIPVVQAVGSPVRAIGFCAPVLGSEIPNGRSEVDAWRVDGLTPERLDLRQVAPVGSSSQFGALFGPPGDGRVAVWGEGRIVFRHTEIRTGFERWFAIEIAADQIG